MKVIIFNNNDGVAVMFPAPNVNLTVEEIAQKDVPKGTEYFIIDEESLPTEPQESWVIKDGLPVVDSYALSAYQINKAEQQRTYLAQAAAFSITPLQYAADLEEATDNETEQLKKWKQYIVALNRLDMSTAPDISWPETPTM